MYPPQWFVQYGGYISFFTAPFLIFTVQCLQPAGKMDSTVIEEGPQHFQHQSIKAPFCSLFL